MRSRYVFGASLTLAVFVGVLGPTLLSSQTTATISIPRFGTYEGGIDIVNVGSLEINMIIPLYKGHKRGSGVDEDISLQYNSGIATQPTRFAAYDTYLSPNWSINSGTGAGAQAYYTDTEKPCGKGTRELYQYYFIDDRGIQHNFAGDTYSECNPTSVTNPASGSLNNVSAEDGSGAVLVSALRDSGIVRDVSGRQYPLVERGRYYSSVIDTNGNGAFSVTYVGPQVTWVASCTYASTFGLVSGVPASVAAVPQPASSGQNPIISGGCIGSDGNQTPVYISYLDTSGTPQSIMVTFALHTLQYGFGSATPSSYCLPSANPSCQYQVPMVSSVSFPDGTGYGFTYETDTSGNYSGRLASMTLPGGGLISYGYSSEHYYDNSINSLTRTTSDGTTTYTRTVLSGGTLPVRTQTIVQYPDGHSESGNYVHDVYISTDSSGVQTKNVTSGGGYYETGRTVFSGSTSSTSLKSESWCYNGITSSCNSQTIILPITEIAHTETVAGMTGGETDYYNLAGLLTEKDEYGFGATTPTRKTVTTYAALGNNILDRPSTVTVYDGNSNVAGQTSYSYDEYSLSSSGVSSLSAISGSRGNQTSATKYSSASASVVSHAHFDDAGQTVSTADGNGNVTLYGYDSTDTYLTRKTYPTVTAGTFSETFTVDSSTGLTTKSKNLSSNITGYAYDSMLRKTGVCSADGGYTLTSYPSSTTQTVARLTGSGAGCTAGGGTPSGTFATSTMEYDGYGRLLHNTDPAGDVTDTSYDSMGRIYSQSNPHTGASTSGTVYHIYDALGRETKRTDQDGSFQYWCYNGVSTAGQPNCKSHIGSKTGTWVDYQDENGNQWQRTSDALGRLIEVAEPNGASTAATMETDYSFDALDNLLSVTQYGGLYGTSGSRTRSFNYDRLSRLLCASNPENSTGICSSTASGAYVPGTTGYTYDANGNVTSKTDARGVVTNYSYDALNRLYAKTYTNAPAGTLSSCYQFDASTMMNGIGRLAAAWTQSGTCASTLPANYQSLRTYGAYDAMGRALTEQQCVAGYCTSTSPPVQPTANCTNLSSATGLQYCYDLAGSLLAYSNGLTAAAAGQQYPQHALLFSQTFDAAGRLNSVASSWNDTTHPQSLFSSPVYTPFNALSSWLLGTQLSTTRTYDTRLRVTGQSSAQ